MKKLRIAQVAPLWERVPPPKYGGIEMGVHLLTEELIKRGHQVTLFAAGTSETRGTLIPGYPEPLYRAGISWNNFVYPYLNQLKAFESSQQYDVIHLHICLWQDYLSLPLSRFVSSKVLYTFRSVLPTKNETDSEKATLLRKYPNNNYISISDAQRDGWVNLNWLKTIYNGIDITRFPFDSRGGDYLVWVGKIRPEKGVDIAIQAALKSNERLILAGPIDRNHRERFHYWETKVKPFVDGKRIIYVGELTRKEISELFKNAKAFLNPILWPEAFGLVMAESQASGTPVIAFRKGSVPEVVKDHETGFVVDSEEEMVEAIKNIKGIKRKACRKWAEENFSHLRMVDEYEEIYNQILNTK
ncbi:MAG: glycosyltransferase family 4 protein [Candidatus Kuenenia stuttgartiensis]|nr:glycosyltransferase family 4 protein [Candidatus Kuenenia stuttgartiensis]